MKGCSRPVTTKSVALPPLRARREDVLPLADHFLAGGRHDGARPAMSEALLRDLLQRSWPGNVRELRSLIERLRLLNSEKLTYDLPDLNPEATSPAIPTAAPAAGPAASPAENATEESVATFRSGQRTSPRRHDLIRSLFSKHGRLNRSEIVHLLGVSPLTVTRDLKMLAAEGLIEKVTSNASPRTHYFRLRSPSPWAKESFGATGPPWTLEFS
jgi:DNA-binding NtrC family response regulator